MLRLAKAAFLLLVFSLPFTKPELLIGGLGATVTDLIYLAAVAALAVAVAQRQAKLRWIRFYVVILAYFAVMLVSGFAATDPAKAMLKLATQLYLLSLPLLACTLIDSDDDLRAVFRTWLAATAVVASVGALTVALFWIGYKPALLEYGLHGYGTLAPGHYPRVESTFAYPAMLCNYLTVSLMILLVCRHQSWIGEAQYYGLLVLISFTAVFSLTPGLGGFILAIGLWIHLDERNRRPLLALAGLSAGMVAAALFLLAAAITPTMPSVRLLAWQDAAARVMQHPLLGTGIGADAVSVEWVDPFGQSALVTDAHNVFLNFAAQCGLLGLAAMVLLVVEVAKRTGPIRLKGHNVLRLGLGLAWLNAFVYQGMTGSYEDARHLWVLLGLLLAADRLNPSSSDELYGKRASLYSGKPDSRSGSH